MALTWRGAPVDPAELVAQVAESHRDLLLRVHRNRLRWEDLEDCYSQATLELVGRARRSPFESSSHAQNALDWAVLAAIGKVECDHGRDPDPSCSHEGSLNYAGAGGPAQFLISTWKQYGMDGDGDGTRDMWTAPDAIFAMARYLRASGAPADYSRAIFSYNHAGWYVQKVLGIAAGYRAAAADRATSGVRAQGYVSPIPAGARLVWMRIDQGQDLQTDPGVGLRAIGDGLVTKAVDPRGFGPDYAVLRLTSGPQAGHSYYYGHTHVSVLGPVHAGEVICHTGTHGVGNATSPGWAEIGAWPPGSMTAGASVAPFIKSLPRV